MARWSVYIVRCADDTLYTGISTDVAERVKKHNSGDGAKYTRSRRPVRLAWCKLMRTESAARKKEIKIKRLTRQEKEKLIQDEI